MYEKESSVSMEMVAFYQSKVVRIVSAIGAFTLPHSRWDGWCATSRRFG